MFTHLRPARTTALLALAGTLIGCPTLAEPFTLIGAAPKTLTPAALASAQGTFTHGHASPDGKALTFEGKAVRLVAVTGPDSDMLSYRIDGLRNPTLTVPRGATLRVLFVNADDDMYHNLRVGPWRSQFPADASPLMSTSVGTPPLPHKTATAYHAEVLTLKAPAGPGKYAYFCTVRGHAPGGMWGTLIVR